MLKVKSRKSYCLFVAILVYSLIFFIISPLYMGADDTFYCDLAKHLYEDHEYVSSSGETHNSPGLPYLLTFFMFFFSSEMSIKVVTFLSLFLLFYGIYFLGKEMHSENCGYLSVLLVMTMPLIPMYFLRILTDVPFLSFSVLMILFYVKSIKNTDRNRSLLYAVVLGSLMWTTISMRVTGILLIELMFFFSFFLYVFKRNNSVFYLTLSFLVFLSFSLINIPGNDLSHLKSLLFAFVGKGSVGSYRLTETSGIVISDIVERLNERSVPIQMLYLNQIIFMLLRWIFLPAMVVFMCRMYKNIKERKEFEIFMILWVIVFASFYVFVFHAFLRPRDIIPMIPPFIILFSIYLVENIKKRRIAVAFLVIHLIASPFFIHRSVVYQIEEKDESWSDAYDWFEDDLKVHISDRGITSDILKVHVQSNMDRLKGEKKKQADFLNRVMV